MWNQFARAIHSLLSLVGEDGEDGDGDGDDDDGDGENCNAVIRLEVSM